MAGSLKQIFIRIKSLILEGGNADNNCSRQRLNGAEKSKYELATFAGGCFWCMVGPFEALEGVVKVISGYTGGYRENPTYEQVCSGKTGHFEAVQITFDPKIVGYESLLEVFWHQIDPTDTGGQFHDRGKSYRSAIFYHNELQRQQAVDSKKILNESNLFSAPVATLILPATTFYAAEEYHQGYYRKNAARYSQYRTVSGRDEFLHTHWNEEDTECKDISINSDTEHQLR